MGERRCTACGVSDVGTVRQNNEDVWAELSDLQCYILADGMGGHQAGEVAAKEAVDTLCRTLKRQLPTKGKTLAEASAVIKQAIEHVNQHVYKMGRSTHELKGMGTTLCLLLVRPEGVVLAHVGDSRIYRFRNNVLELLTQDHSLLAELVQRGKLTQEEQEQFQYKNIITKAVGTEPQIVPSVEVDLVEKEDLFLLCSDGLSDLLTVDEIQQVIANYGCLSETALQLVSLSKNKGGHDNITVLLVRA